MKSNTQTAPPQTTKRKHLLMGGVVLAVVVIVALVALALYNFMRNPAEEVANPLEQALIANGAVKKCNNGDAGRGPDNREPNYGGRYQLSVGKEEATKLIEKVAKDNGYTLTHKDSPYDSIEWYSDNSSRDSTYSDLEPGKVRLSMSTYSDTNTKELTCLDGTKLQGDEMHTAVSLSVVLPLRR